MFMQDVFAISLLGLNGSSKCSTHVCRGHIPINPQVSQGPEWESWSTLNRVLERVTGGREAFVQRLAVIYKEWEDRHMRIGTT